MFSEALDEDVAAVGQAASVRTSQLLSLQALVRACIPADVW